MSAPPEGAFLDERPRDPTWWPPAESNLEVAPTEPGRRRWRPPPLLLGVLVIGVVLGLIWALGGFGRRTDLNIDTPPGALISTGPYEFSFTRATAQRVNRFGSGWSVEVKVFGTGRTTGQEAIAPSTLDPMFAAFDERTREAQDMDGQRFGPGATYGHGSSFTPGLPPVDYAVTFQFSDNYRPGDTITFAVSELEFSDTTLLGTGEKVWNNADRRFVMQLPVTRLPDEK